MVTQRVLLIQLARLGDLVQTFPAIASVKKCHAEWDLDLLCPASLEGLGRTIPGVSKVVPWDGAAWGRRAMSAEAAFHPEHVAEAEADLREITEEPYDRAVVLNQHPRALLAGALLAKEVSGVCVGQVCEKKLSAWAEYVRTVAGARGHNRIHLADAFCGMCGVLPPQHAPTMGVSPRPLPRDLEPIGRSTGPWIGLLVGAGDPERVVPREVWSHFVHDCLESVPACRIVLVGQTQEQARAEWIQASLPPSLVGRVWDTTGRLSLTELVTLLTRCQVVVGADTGPLHLAAAVGTPVIGWYFARARVHETGPYGEGHWVWQIDRMAQDDQNIPQPHFWPIDETRALISQASMPHCDGWSLWASHRDQWGAYYLEAGRDVVAPIQREQVWKELQPAAA